MKRLIIVSSIIFSLIMISGNSIADSKPNPFNRVTVIIDSSGTFKNHQFEAIEKVKGLLDKIGEQKEKRYQAPDEIYIISLDAQPEVIWFGKRPQIEKLTPEKLAELFSERKKYNHCTDIAEAFNLAGYKLNRNPIPSAKFLFAFTDLIDEPLLSSGKKCKSPIKPSLPSETIKWNLFSDISIGVFWSPDSQTIAWEEALADKQLNIKFYNESEAQNLELPPIPKARWRMTVEEQEARKEKIIGVGSVIMKSLVYLSIGFIALVGIIIFINRKRR